VLPWQGALGKGAEVQAVRMWPAPDHTRVVFDITAPVEHSVFRLNSPERVVIDLRDTRLAIGSVKPQAGDN